MPITVEGEQPRVIVIPRPLEGFFYERLTGRYASSPEVQVIVDRRLGERRAQRRTSAPEPLSDRRRSERRQVVITWSLPDMPFSAA